MRSGISTVERIMHESQRLNWSAWSFRIWYYLVTLCIARNFCLGGKDRGSGSD